MEERMMILRMLDEGKITSDEALELLKAVGETGAVEQKDAAESIQANTKQAKSDRQTDANQHEQADKKERSTGSKLSGFLDKLLTRLKESDLDFNFGPSIEINHVFQENELDIDRMKIHITNGGIQLQPWEEPSIRVECKALIYRVSSQEAAKDYFIDNVQFSVDSSQLQLLVDDSKLKVFARIYVPTKLYEQVQLRTSNGAIIIDEIKTKQLNIRTSNGAVTLSQLVGNELKASTSNGKIKVEDGQWKSSKLETLNGTIRIHGRYDNVEAETLNGTITFLLDKVHAGKASLKTVAGRIEMLLPDGLRIEGDMKATIGNVNCHLENVEIIKENKEMVQKRLNFIANKDAPTTYKMAAETKTGSIVVAKR